jgi:hypothetical protein
MRLFFHNSNNLPPVSSLSIPPDLNPYETANLLSVIQTCRFQARSVMAFFHAVISAHSCDLTMPELIPLFQT